MFGITKVFADVVEQAQNDAAVAGSSQAFIANSGPLIVMVALFAIMYFVLIRPQKKQEKEAKAMLAALAVGDKIVTIGGIWGKIVKIKDDYIFIETGNIGNPNECTVLKMERQSVKLVEKKSSKKEEKAEDKPEENTEE